MADVLNLVAISGSLRAASYNSALIRLLPGFAPAGLQFSTQSIIDIPLYNGDVEDVGIPAAVTALRAAMRSADGVVIATPEYNHGIPGVLKNTIDWLSRPPSPHAFYGVPVAILGASDGSIGTTRAQSALRQTLAALNAPTMPFPQVLVAHVDKKIDAAGNLHDPGTGAFLQSWLIEVERWMRRFPRAERS